VFYIGMFPALSSCLDEEALLTRFKENGARSFALMLKEIETHWGKVQLTQSAGTLITIRWYHNAAAAATIPDAADQDDSTVMPAEILATYCAPSWNATQSPLPAHVLDTVCTEEVHNWLHALRGPVRQEVRF
jgi:hypothetical protein